jgi:hypothetical protein
MNKNDKLGIIKRAREIKMKWDDIGYILNTNPSTCRSLYKRAQEVEELGENPILRKGKFEAKVILKLKQLARDHPKKSFRDLEADLEQAFPGKPTPKKSTINDILKRSGFK